MPRRQSQNINEQITNKEFALEKILNNKAENSQAPNLVANNLKKGLKKDDKRISQVLDKKPALTKPLEKVQILIKSYKI